MKNALMLSVLSILFFASPAFAASDLEVSITPAAGVFVYDTGTYTVTVSNTGNRNARNVVLNIQLPETNTSPTVHIMGALSGYSSRCTQSGTALSCTWNRVKKNKSKSISFDIALPYSSAPLVIDADVTTTSNENNLNNNSASYTATPLTYNTGINAPATAVNNHCSGTNLTSFFECMLYPSSISSFDSILESNGSITITNPTPPPNTTGQWTQPAPDALFIEYFTNGQLTGTLDARGVGNNCFEGPMVFPNSTWVALYEVCL